MAEGAGNRTLAVAVAGIAATALVGLAGTAAAWLSARDDRATQRAMARDERTYERRVLVYLDAIDFVEGQQYALERYSGRPLTKRGKDIPYHFAPPRRLATRLSAFGSPEVRKAFYKTQRVNRRLFRLGVDIRGYGPLPTQGGYIDVTDSKPPGDGFDNAYFDLSADLRRLEDAVHNEIG